MGDMGGLLNGVALEPLSLDERNVFKMFCEQLSVESISQGTSNNTNRDVILENICDDFGCNSHRDCGIVSEGSNTSNTPMNRGNDINCVINEDAKNMMNQGMMDDNMMSHGIIGDNIMNDMTNDQNEMHYRASLSHSIEADGIDLMKDGIRQLEEIVGKSSDGSKNRYNNEVMDDKMGRVLYNKSIDMMGKNVDIIGKNNLMNDVNIGAYGFNENINNRYNKNNVKVIDDNDNIMNEVGINILMNRVMKCMGWIIEDIGGRDARGEKVVDIYEWIKSMLSIMEIDTYKLYEDTITNTNNTLMLAHPDEFKNPSSFLKIYGDPLCGNGSRRFSQSGQGYNGNKSALHPVKGQNGNWICRKCNNINFPRRFKCNKCYEARDVEGDRIVADYAKFVYQNHILTSRSSSKNGRYQKNSANDIVNISHRNSISSVGNINNLNNILNNNIGNNNNNIGNIGNGCNNVMNGPKRGSACFGSIKNSNYGTQWGNVRNLRNGSISHIVSTLGINSNDGINKYDISNRNEDYNSTVIGSYNSSMAGSHMPLMNDQVHQRDISPNRYTMGSMDGMTPSNILSAPPGTNDNFENHVYSHFDHEFKQNDINRDFYRQNDINRDVYKQNDYKQNFYRQNDYKQHDLRQSGYKIKNDNGINDNFHNHVRNILSQDDINSITSPSRNSLPSLSNSACEGVFQGTACPY